MTRHPENGIPAFDRRFLGSEHTFTRIGNGAIGGKASGLNAVRTQVLTGLDPAAFPQFTVTVPTLTVLGIDLFDAFLQDNQLSEIVRSGADDEQIAHAFQRATLSSRFLGDLRALSAGVHRPLAVRSSSLLEDALEHPFAGVYATKMIPNNQPETDTRFQRLVEAIKFVYASTFFRQARSYAASIGRDITTEKMAILIQEIVGERFDTRFYPHISGVARSYNFYPMGHARPEDGVVNLALGLGKQIVDGGLNWTYSPAYPHAPPPYADIGERLKFSQTEFWAVNMGPPPLPDPIKETEYLLRLGLKDAELDGTLEQLVSTYDVRSDRLRPGIGQRGPRVLDFAPLLETQSLPLNDLVRRLLELAEAYLDTPVEIEFAVTLPRSGSYTGGRGPAGRTVGRAEGTCQLARFGFLQMRPMRVTSAEIEVTQGDLQQEGVVVASVQALGNGARDDISDVLFLKPDAFEPGRTAAMAAELDQLNRDLTAAGRHSLLIGFGRWGSSDRWLGVPVEWAQVSSARVIVESSLPDMNPDLSQGSHFFHNLLSFEVLYLSVKHREEYPVDWEYLQSQPTVAETQHVKHVRCRAPLIIRVDGRSGRGVILRGPDPARTPEGNGNMHDMKINPSADGQHRLSPDGTGTGSSGGQPVEDPRALGSDQQTAENLLAALSERAKELSCLYRIEMLLKDTDQPPGAVFPTVVKAIGPGWQFPEVCEAALLHEGQLYKSSDFTETNWFLQETIEVMGEDVGELRVYYTAERPASDVGPFLKEEVRLIQSLADALGKFLFIQRVHQLGWDRTEARSLTPTPDGRGWRTAIDLLRDSDKNLYLRVARKMLNHLCSVGIPAAQAMLQEMDPSADPERYLVNDANIPAARRRLNTAVLLSDDLFDLAAQHLYVNEILERVRRWIQEDKVSFFVKILGNPRSTLPEIADSLRRFHNVIAEGVDLSESTLKSLRVSLCQRFLTEQLDFIKTAKEYAKISAFHDLLDRIIMPTNSHGKLGGKGSGLLLAQWILKQAATAERPVGNVEVPKTWYITSDGVLEFVAHNDLEDVIEQKFKEIEAVRREYPNIIQLFKNSPFPPELIHGISAALDDLGDKPVIIRSSSLLEDRLGTAFSGKYKSLFLANQGTKQERLEAMVDAIAEIYASTFGPDPIEYRRERGLLEFHEEMGILIQEVVGVQVGKYYLPAFAGVAFSNNEFRWSPRIEREDGLIRLVPGLGTRAVDRTADDYPILAVPGKPNLRVNVAVDEVVRYSPRNIDVINLETNSFETLDLHALLREVGSDYPALTRLFSVLSGDSIKKPLGLLVDTEREELVATFEGMIADTPFMEHTKNILKILQEHLGTPVDIEFAHDGTDFYLLQCRPQSYSRDVQPAPIPKDLPDQDILFTAKRYVSNGWVPEVTHLVYVDPAAYGRLGSRADLLAVGRAVGRLNKVLPKRQFILMGPGRWGSRGDIKLGVSVTYADISNSAMLIEIARQSGQYVPDLSFGTHFFQDLVESHIRYLPLYPDTDGTVFSERFLQGAPNLLPTLLPDFANLADVVRVIDVPATSDGRILRVAMNADLDEAIAYFATPGALRLRPSDVDAGVLQEPLQYWRWRLRMAERIALEMDAEQFGVEAIYIFGSVKNATAGPGSDIDLLVHFRGDDRQRSELMRWFEGWSLCLAEMNYMRTGYRTDGLLDVHLVTDEDITRKSSYAVKIGAITDPARPLMLGQDKGA